MSLILLEFRALGVDLPPAWAALLDQRPDLEGICPLLFRDVAKVGQVPEPFDRHFLVPVEWVAHSQVLVVRLWTAPGLEQVDRPGRLALDGFLLSHFRLFQAVPGNRVPQALPDLYVPTRPTPMTRMLAV